MRPYLRAAAASVAVNVIPPFCSVFCCRLKIGVGENQTETRFIIGITFQVAFRFSSFGFRNLTNTRACAYNTHTHTHTHTARIMLARGSVRLCCLMSSDVAWHNLLGTSWDQCRCMVQYCFTSTDTRRLVRTDSPGRPPRLSHSSTLRASLSGTFLQTLPDSVTPLKGHSLSACSCPATRSAPSERFGYW